MKVYLIWATDLSEEIDTSDRDNLIHPHTPKYGPFYLIPYEYEALSKLKCEVMDLSKIKIVDEPSSEDEKTETEFLNLHDQLAATARTGKCVVLSVAQGRLLHKERYNNEVSE